MLINVKMPTFVGILKVGILTLISRMNAASESFKARTIFFFSISVVMSS